ncbi:MAG: CDP-glucose 4,6-dehydratase, partial [Spirochaetaceae bacterium]|nr:CDP-glucose 4,6-dehydratase [Spirochaetaceae bacterium]
LGARVCGYSLPPPTDPSLFALADLGRIVPTTMGDVRDRAAVAKALRDSHSQIVFHLAAQPIVRESYADPIGTYETNVMGTANLLEAVRGCPEVRAVVVVTTDKCYENREWEWGYREIDALGGHDPYSSSKACSEIVAAAYRRSFFSGPGAKVATTRAGNVIGGGDWAKDRLLPDMIRAIERGEPVRIRSPRAVRPWQHVLEPLSGYLALARRLYEDGEGFDEAWNFGPEDDDARAVEWIIKRICELWEGSKSYIVDAPATLHEATMLKLDCSKAKARLGWRPRWSLDEALTRIVSWNKTRLAGADILAATRAQIADYMRLLE